MKSYCLHFLLLCASWFLCLAVYFPGVGMNDGLNILAGRLASANQFPIWYCVYVVILEHIGNMFGSLQYSIIIYSIIQVIITAAISAGIICWIRRHTTNRILRFLVSAYYILQPVLAVYAITMVKDTVFSALLVLYGILLYEMVVNAAGSSRWFMVLFTLSSLVLCGIRSNGSYIVALCLVYLWCVSRADRRLVIITTLLIVIMTMSGNALMNHYDVHRSKAEALAIPIQQICAVVAEGGVISDADIESLEHFISADDARQLYTPGDVDAVKWSDAFNRKYLNTHTGEFMTLWFHLLSNNLGTYVKAYLQQTYWFWAPDQRDIIYMMFTIEGYANNDWLEPFAQANGIHDAPILTGVISDLLRTYYHSGIYYLREGVCLWIMIISLITARFRKWNMRHVLLIYAPQILCWLTIMASTPVNNSFRYVLYYAYALPLYALFLVQNSLTAKPDQP